MYLKELETISHSVQNITTLLLVVLIINILLVAISLRSLIGSRRLAQGMKFLLIVNSQRPKSSDTKSEEKK